MRVTDGDREKAMDIMAWTPLTYESFRAAADEGHPDDLDAIEIVEAIAVALAEERERERSQWNPMIGRVIQVAQEWERDTRTIWTDKAAKRIHDAIRGDQ